MQLESLKTVTGQFSNCLSKENVFLQLQNKQNETSTDYSCSSKNPLREEKNSHTKGRHILQTSCAHFFFKL